MRKDVEGRELIGLRWNEQEGNGSGVRWSEEKRRAWKEWRI